MEISCGQFLRRSRCHRMLCRKRVRDSSLIFSLPFKPDACYCSERNVFAQAMERNTMSNWLQKSELEGCFWGRCNVALYSMR